MLKRFYLGFSLEDSGFANLDGPFSNSSVEAAFIPNYMILCHRFNSNHILQALFHLRFTSKALPQLIDSLLLAITRTL